MSEQGITDRAEVLLLASHEAGDGPGKAGLVIPAAKTPPASAPSGEDCIACPGCGASSGPGPGCDSCGSPLSLGIH